MVNAVNNGMNRFEFMGELGRGSFGVVYRVRYKPQFSNDTTVYALKVVTFTRGTLDRRELEVISSVCMTDSPFIVRVYNWWYEFDARFDRYCILMEFCDNNLGSYLQHRYEETKMPLSEGEIWDITCNIMEGIQKCHDLNYTHRDLKPQNILYSSRTKTWKLTDFGIAAKLPASILTAPILNHLPSPPSTGPFLQIPPAGSNISFTKRGSPGYVAPELLYSGICSRKGDIWSVGCILYELSCGKLAFPPSATFGPQDPLRMYFCGNGEPPEVAREDNPRIMEVVGKNYFGGPVSGRYRINQVIAWCLEREPSERPKVNRLVSHVKSVVFQN
jgi:serine/threonine protein kinase